MRHITVMILVLLGVWIASGLSVSAAENFQCAPTRPDSMGPFYEPGAPLRSSVGEGYVLTGKVKSAADCDPIARAEIEFWLVNPEGRYDDAHRATVIADGAGAYGFKSNRPSGYAFRPPHIHIRVTAEGFEPLVTQHYPEEGVSRAEFDLVLVPE